MNNLMRKELNLYSQEVAKMLKSNHCEILRKLEGSKDRTNNMNYQEKAKELARITSKTLVDEFVHSAIIALEIFSIEIEKTDDITCTLAFIFQAGKIEGTRKERARRKVKKE
ncbi:hypothetical protein [Tissierella sp.]|uniref:hypothetical protein n=1 Tax=Tissierella sp. TaxID=41274 RepID=UPI00285EA28B|nr:hypothetical protein [Tissierella sp.]MDR7856064.1 hypothetical protein [Tissierella sp.]